MKWKSICGIALAVLLGLSATQGLCDEKIVLGSLDWEPYIGQKLQGQGWVAEVVRAAFKRSGVDIDIAFKPWARVVYEAKNGTSDGYFPEYYSDELKKNFVLSDPFPGGPLGFFKRKGDPITFTDLKSLTPYKIGVVRGYVNTADFDSATFLKKDEAKDDLTNIKKLLAKRIDLMVADQYVGLYLLEQNMPDKMGQIEFISPPLEEKDLYVCISKKTNDYQTKIEKFNAGLKQIQADGTFNAIMKKHGF